MRIPVSSITCLLVIVSVSARGVDRPRPATSQEIAARRPRQSAYPPEQDALTVADFKALEKQLIAGSETPKRDHRFTFPKYSPEYTSMYQQPQDGSPDKRASHLPEMQVGCAEGFTADGAAAKVRSRRSASPQPPAWLPIAYQPVGYAAPAPAPYPFDYPRYTEPRTYFNPGHPPVNPHAGLGAYLPPLPAAIIGRHGGATAMHSHEEDGNYDELSKFPTYNPDSPAGYIPKPDDDLEVLAPTTQGVSGKDPLSKFPTHQPLSPSGIIPTPDDDIDILSPLQTKPVYSRPLSHGVTQEKRGNPNIDDDGITKTKPLEYINAGPFGIIPAPDDNIEELRARQILPESSKHPAASKRDSNLDDDPDGITKTEPLQPSRSGPFGIIPSPDDNIDELRARQIRPATGRREKHMNPAEDPDDGITKDKPLEHTNPSPFGIIPSPDDDIDELRKRQKLPDALLKHPPVASALRRSTNPNVDDDGITKDRPLQHTQSGPFGIIPAPEDDIEMWRQRQIPYLPESHQKSQLGSPNPGRSHSSPASHRSKHEDGGNKRSAANPNEDEDGLSKTRPLQHTNAGPFGVIPKPEDDIEVLRKLQLQFLPESLKNQNAGKHREKHLSDDDGITKTEPLGVLRSNPVGLIPSPDDDIDELSPVGEKVVYSRPLSHGVTANRPDKRSNPNVDDDGITKTKPLEYITSGPFGIIPLPNDDIEELRQRQIPILPDSLKNQAKRPASASLRRDKHEDASAGSKAEEDSLSKFPTHDPPSISGIIPSPTDDIDKLSPSKANPQKSSADDDDYSYEDEDVDSLSKFPRALPSDADPLSKFPSSKQPVPSGIIPGPHDDLDTLSPKRQVQSSDEVRLGAEVARVADDARSDFGVIPKSDDDIDRVAPLKPKEPPVVDPLSKFPTYNQPAPDGYIPRPEDDIDILSPVTHSIHPKEIPSSHDPLSKFPTDTPASPSGHIPSPDENIDTLSPSETDALSKFPAYSPAAAPAAYIPDPTDSVDELSPRLAHHHPSGGGDPVRTSQPASPPRRTSPRRYPSEASHNRQNVDPAADPGRCVWALVTCCAHNSDAVRAGCFHQMGCAGPFESDDPCSEDNANATMRRAQDYYRKD